MGGPNRKLRRAMEARARKEAKNAPPVSSSELTLRSMYDQKVMEVQSLFNQLNQAKALAAALLVEADMDEVTISLDTIEALKTGFFQDVERVINDDGTVTVILVMEEDEDADDSAEEEE